MTKTPSQALLLWSLLAPTFLLAQTPTPSNTPTPTPTPTVTPPTGSPTPTAAATPIPTPPVTPSPRPTFPPSVIPTDPDGTITADAQSVNPGIRSFTVTSPYQHGPNELEVLLPDDYTPNKQYPVVYMLPVNTGTTGPWGSSIVEAKKDDLQNEFHMIFVAPAYEVVPWFGDNPDRKDVRQNSYMLNVVVPFVDKQFSTIKAPNGRFLIGFSKAGMGAWSLFLQHLDEFGQVAIFDSFEGPPTQKQWNTWGFVDTYGTRENYDLYDPFILLDQDQDLLKVQPRRITILGGGPGSRVGVDKYHTRLQDYKIPFVYIQGSDMTHTWTSGWLPLAVTSLAHPETQPQP